MEPIYQLLNQFESVGKRIDLESREILQDTLAEKRNVACLQSSLKTLESEKTETAPLKEIQNFLISRSLMDCSIMIRLEKHPHSTPSSNHSFTQITNTHLYYTIGIVDVEPKSAYKIPHYYQQQQQVLEYYQMNPLSKRCQ